MKSKRFFKNIIEAKFTDRPNRFLINCEINKNSVKAFLPNPGRLQELLFPGSTVYLTYNPDSSRKTQYTAAGVLKNEHPVMLHTHKSNKVVRYLLDNKLVPGLEDTEVLRAEVPYKNSRFDFLLKKGSEKIYLEVKSCTLFGEKICMFPDAITERGRRHIEELAELSKEGIKTSVIFLVHYYDAEFFMPDYHTDLLFAKTFLRCRNLVNFIPVAIKWNKDLTLEGKTKKLEIPWKKIEEEAEDRGSYMILFELKKRTKIKVGSAGEIAFNPGYYIYVGSAMKNLSQRIKRHCRLRKNHHWHIDYLREEATILADFPVRSAERLECEIAGKMTEISDFSVTDFGSSDCKCPSHLFGFQKNPLEKPEFIKEIIQYFRIDRLYDLIKNIT